MCANVYSEPSTSLGTHNEKGKKNKMKSGKRRCEIKRKGEGDDKKIVDIRVPHQKMMMRRRNDEKDDDDNVKKF